MSEAMDIAIKALEEIAEGGLGRFGRRPDDVAREALTVLRSTQQQGGRPIDMVLFCPACGLQHIDAADAEASVELSGRETRWDNPPHRSHLCHGCGHIWRPADVATNGVAAIQTKGSKDSPIAAPSQQEEVARLWSDDVLDRVEEWVNRRGGDADVREIAQALIAAMPHQQEEVSGWREFVRRVGRLGHTGDDGASWPDDPEDAVLALDGVIAQARDLMAKMAPSPTGEPAPNPYGPLIEAAKAYREINRRGSGIAWARRRSDALLKLASAAERLEGESL